jgi:outer membrane protein OmpA-like peptidoglycan-associated protein
MRDRREDVSVWVGYADFLTTLAVLFFVMALSAAGRNRVGEGEVSGQVSDVAGQPPTTPCEVRIADSVVARTTPTKPKYAIKLRDIRGALTLTLLADCSGYDPVPRLLTIRAGSSQKAQLTVRKTTTMRVETLQGDALFDVNSSTLKPEAVEIIQSLSARMRPQLQLGDIIAVEGHSDDQEFRSNSARDNWVLSAERANAAAKVLISSGIPACNVVIMGFGPSRPIEPLTAGDSREIRNEKRAKNRRIEFRQLRSTGLRGNCAS